MTNQRMAKLINECDKRLEIINVVGLKLLSIIRNLKDE
jgi:hypothetical protein